MLGPEETQIAVKILKNIYIETNTNKLNLYIDSLHESQTRALNICISEKYVTGIQSKLDYSHQYIFDVDNPRLTDKGIHFIKPFSKTNDVNRLIKEALNLIDDNNIYILNGELLPSNSALTTAIKACEDNHYCTGINCRSTKLGVLVLVSNPFITEKGNTFLNPKKVEVPVTNNFHIERNNGSVTGVNNGTIQIGLTVDDYKQLFEAELNQIINLENAEQVNEFKKNVYSGNIKPGVWKRFNYFLKDHDKLISYAGQIITAIALGKIKLPFIQ